MTGAIVRAASNARSWWHPIPEIPVGTFYLKCLWIVIQLVAAYWFSSRVSPFFYQRF
jgi:hypothetical protein